jgi:hypothetical protein
VEPASVNITLMVNQTAIWGLPTALSGISTALLHYLELGAAARFPGAGSVRDDPSEAEEAALGSATAHIGLHYAEAEKADLKSAVAGSAQPQPHGLARKLRELAEAGVGSGEPGAAAGVSRGVEEEIRCGTAGSQAEAALPAELAGKHSSRRNPPNSFLVSAFTK